MKLINKLKEIGCQYQNQIEYNDRYKSYVFTWNNDVIIVDYEFHKDYDNVFDYSIYCSTQNEYMKKTDRLFRFVYHDGTDILSKVKGYLFSEVVDINNTNNFLTHNHYDNTVAEKAIEDLFVDAYGNEALSYLYKEYEFGISNGKKIYIDYLVETNHGNIALEANGVSYHHPCLVEENYYEHLLEKQNALSLLGIKVFRFSMNNLIFKDQIIDKIKEYMGNKKEFIPKPILTSSRGFALYNCQTDALTQIDHDRLNGQISSLIVLPTAAGKSEVFLSDIEKEYVRKVVKNILIMAQQLVLKKIG